MYVECFTFCQVHNILSYCFPLCLLYRPSLNTKEFSNMMKCGTLILKL